jgi:uncharacterized protein
MKTFLSAEWRNLLNLTYEVPVAALSDILPPGLEIDLLDHKAHVSLVAFDFLHTKVKGIQVPFHTNFPEVNLRYYVRYKGRRGVVFIREFVPKHCIALIANRVYNEPYLAFPMESKVDEREGGGLRMQHQIWKGKDTFRVMADVGSEVSVPGPETIAHFFKEHDLGFGVDKKGETLAYLVEHPVWATREVISCQVEVDFEKFYGAEWGFLTGMEPTYKLFAEGSAIKVFSAVKLEDL